MGMNRRLLRSGIDSLSKEFISLEILEFFGSCTRDSGSNLMGTDTAEVPFWSGVRHRTPQSRDPALNGPQNFGQLGPWTAMTMTRQVTRSLTSNHCLVVC